MDTNPTTTLPEARKRTLRSLVAMRRPGLTPARQVQHLIDMGVRGEPTPAAEVAYFSELLQEYEGKSAEEVHALDLAAMVIHGNETPAELEDRLKKFKESE